MTITNNIAKEAVDFQKTVFNDSYNLWVKYTDNVETIASTFIERYGNLPENIKENINQINGKVKEGRNQFKKLVDENFDNLGRVLSN